jgi:VanZ family protein
MTRAPGWRVLAASALLAVALQLYGVYRVTGPPTPSWFPDADKVEHAVGFGLPVALVLLTLGARSGPALRRRRAVGAVTGVFAAHAVVSEVVQHLFYAGRTGDPLDVAADWAGVVLGAVVGVALLRRVQGRVAAP